jgi:hypothetical protein
MEAGARETVEHSFAPGTWRIHLHVDNNMGRSATVRMTVQVSTLGEISGGTPVWLRRERFGDDCRVSFGDRRASAVQYADRFLIATAPSHRAGTVDIQVDCRTTRKTLPGAFTYVDPRTKR